MGNFEKQIHSMFDHIWDCDIDHPVFEDTVGDLMEAVIQCYQNFISAQPYHTAGVGKMVDLISRKAAIASIGKCTDIYVNNLPTMIDKAEAYKALNELPSEQPEPHWIPVSERLPEKNGRYLVTRGLNACGNLWNRTYIVNYSDLMGLKKNKVWWDGNVGKSDFETYDDVLAWMPLPEPLKMEGENDG